MRPRSLLALAIVGLLLTAACGATSSDTASDGPARTIEIDMVDIGFEPDTLQVAQGETIRFVFTNTGTVDHDAFIGRRSAQADHESEMRAMDGDEHGGHGDDGRALTVEPGDRGELTYTFEDGGPVEIGCHQPGHYAAGMRVAVEVT